MKKILSSLAAIGVVILLAVPAAEGSGVFSASRYFPGSVAITGGTINGTIIGGSVPVFLTASSAVISAGTISSAVVITRSYTLSGEQATTSGTSKTFSIPAWATKIFVHFVGVSSNGTSPYQLRIGDSGGTETTGYTTTASNLSNVVASTESTTGFILAQGVSAAGIYNGVARLYLENTSTNTWVMESQLSATNTGSSTLSIAVGKKSLSGALTDIVFTTVNGTDALDLGLLNVGYE